MANQATPRGRPKGGGKRKIKTLLVSEEDDALLRLLAKHYGTSQAGVIRHSFHQLAKKDGIRASDA